ncbi:hypothetical protein [Leptospira bandrabouensis]|uniref:Uncharacterized protein n=1 Tax=Leptospira bandrabouensis TaxID=2484903 RepID=A0A6H3NXH3_9LEPT|nr:hypothetical protein [Leptospira bandrabouensis]MCG6144013.1 hypothetical protein [Leptospira bandrabouensis]MCG6150946.1 hypothetical protein [Leptospira bandrabouensis]MCG6159674.1 hypothetical protein [Leptospira bandrabouensis]MCG6163607.1 hypothetical protein [Leptospira bandrabouensis]MCW7457525.1 hypothetical protein [Leptospira bandrabouensis]
MKSLQNKTKLLILLSLIAGLSLQCEKKENNDKDLLTLVTIGSLFNMAGDCSIAANGKTLNTWTTTSGLGSGTITKTSSVPVVGHPTAVLKYAGTGVVKFTLTGKSEVIVYGSGSCPLDSTKVIKTGITYSAGTLVDDNAAFPDAYKLDGTGTISITAPNNPSGVYILFYALPSKGQSAQISYSIADSL